MSDFVVVKFEKPYGADALLIALKELDKKTPLDLDDSAVVVADNEGKISVERTFEPYEQLPASGALYFGFVGALLGWIFSGAGFWGAVFGLQAGVLFGWIGGFLSARFSVIGVPLEAINRVAAILQPDTSAVCVATRTPLTSGHVLPHLSGFEGELVQSSLPPEEEAKLRTVFG